MVGAVFLIGYLVLTVAHPSPLERQADPTDAMYIPVPDWYFFSMYQLLKYQFASGPCNIIGALVIPGLAIGALCLCHLWIRQKNVVHSNVHFQRHLCYLHLLLLIYLTWESVVNHDWEAAKTR